MTTNNPLIGNSSKDTLNNVSAVLSLVQHVESESCDDSLDWGRFKVLECCRQALEHEAADEEASNVTQFESA